MTFPAIVEFEAFHNLSALPNTFRIVDPVTVAAEFVNDIPVDVRSTTLAVIVGDASDT